MTELKLSRTAFLKLTAALGATTALSACSEPAPAPAEPKPAEPLLQRFRIATINTPNLQEVADWYTTWFDYQVRETGTVPAALATSWGTPAMADKPFTLLSSTGSPDVYIRVVQGDPVTEPVNPRTTFGWGSLEIIVQDLQAQYEKMKAGGVEIFREPASLGGIFESIHAMQLYGPMSITHNLTVETAPPEKSNLPVANSQVDRIFLVGLNGPKLDALSDFYVQNFNMSKGPDYDYPIPVLAEALG
jgi:catechol 2,3-dioxygenase-like lactoylglutathione lyase family enzyme